MSSVARTDASSIIRFERNRAKTTFTGQSNPGCMAWRHEVGNVQAYMAL